MSRQPLLIPRARPAQQYGTIRAELDEAVARVIKRAVFMPDSEVEAFEEEFARYIGVRYAVGVASGGIAIALALLAMDLKRDAEVISVPNVDVSTSAPITHAGGRIVWTDVDPRTYNLDPSRLASTITPKTGALLVVHAYGNPADMGAIAEVAGQYNLPIFEDAAPAPGATYRDRKVGSLGQVGCFSFNPNKILAAFGHAGMVVTNDAEVAQQVRILANYGIQPASINAFMNGQSPRLEVVLEGFNARLDELQAAVLRVKLRYLDGRLRRRRENAGIYREMLAGLGPEHLLLPQDTPGSEPAYRFFVIRSTQRDKLRAYLWQAGIWTGLAYAPPLHLEPVYHYLGYGPGSFPQAELVARELLCLPTYPELSTYEVESIGEAVRKFFSRVRRKLMRN